MAVAAEVLEEGPIAHIDIDRYEDDPGLESAIEHYGVSPTNATYRLLLIDVAKILETRWFPTTQRPAPAHMVEALAQRRLLPPIVVYRATDNPDVFGLLDGVNRTYAHWSLGILRIRAYELITKPA